MTPTVISDTDLRQDAQANGVDLPHLLTPEKFLRFPSRGKDAKNQDAWCFIFADGHGATYGDWSTGVDRTWQAHKTKKMTAAEQAAYRKRIEAIRAQRDALEEQRYADAKKRARAIWDKAIPVKADHPYLTRKQIPFDLVRYWLKVDANNNLLIPVEQWDGISSLQYISPNGDKRFLTGGKVGGGWLVIGGSSNDTTVIVEGFATGCSVRHATGLTVLLAFSAPNLLTVARDLRREDPEGTLVIAADNDFHADGKPNDGLLAAQKAAQAINGILAVPPVLDNHKTDWNDVHTKLGVEAVRKAFEEVLPLNTAPDPGGTMPDMETQTADTAVSQSDAVSNGKTEAPCTPSAETAQLHTPPELAKNPNILAEFGQAVQVCGVVGEVRCAKLVYLMATSRLLDEPVSGVVKGLSSSGKSFTTDTTLKFFPKDALIVMTAMSEKALIYMKEEFAHKTLVIYEASALREQREKNESNLTAYFVRSLLSEGRIVYPVTVRDKQGGFFVENKVKEGPTNMILTTTATSLHGENETRLLSIPTNDSQEQTKAIMLKLAQGKSQTVDFKPWHELQEWLAQAKHQVVIPYAVELAEAIPPVAVRLRRDFRSILRLIEAHAILHQCNRGKDAEGRIVANKADYLAVQKLVADLVAAGVGATVPTTIRETVEAIAEHAGDDGITVKRVGEYLKLDRSAAQRRIQSARERGYLVNLEEKRGKPARYAIGEPMPEEIELLPLSIPESVQHTPPASDTPLHSVSASNSSELAGGVQVCMPSGEVTNGECEEVEVHEN